MSHRLHGCGATPGFYGLGTAFPACWPWPWHRTHHTEHPPSPLHLNPPICHSLTLLNNLAQLAKALSGGASALEVTPVLVSLFSVSNCAGRMAFGYIPERLLHARGTPRLLFLPLVSLLTAGTFLVLGFAHLPALYPLSALAGFAFGE